ncbi:NADH:flavin oxidoreductase [Caballeronia pedi]|uniref:NADH:flavin oxidoreductase n=1 Tax=Caballeronia pedi TaxID=1777141 RepID=A0A158A0G8_9BURK|nr:alkene reductase [Caballeronia pedi]SAK51233.1 NADH:flavin oxidoreductase [Caballeronia pedi]
MPHDTLFSPVTIGKLELPNRIVMAPLARHRASQPGDVPSEMNAHYYAQRASAGLIVTEPTQISRQGQGGWATPGIYTAAQEAGWKGIVGAVHARHGRIAALLSHAGRVSHRRLQEAGAPPVAPSAIRARGATVLIQHDDGTTGFIDAEDPRPLDTDEIAGVVLQYVDAAHRADRAGFDLIEIDAANGCLLHQFIATGTNRRTDDYGGSVENRVRIVVDVLDVVAGVVGAHRVGIRLSPGFTGADIEDAEALASLSHLAGKLKRIGIAYVQLADADDALRNAYDGAIIATADCGPEEAHALIERGTADAVAFGLPFVANPDLVERMQANRALADADPSTLHGGGEAGYTDYPAFDDTQRR